MPDKSDVMKPELSESFLKNLEQIAEGLNGRPINTDFSAEWKLSAANVMLLLEYMYKSGVIEIVWRAELQTFCFMKKVYTIN